MTVMDRGRPGRDGRADRPAARCRTNLALPAATRYRWVWAAAVPLLWALGWTMTTLAGVAVEEQFSVFGAAGAVTFSALSGVLLNVLLPARDSTATVASTPTGATLKDNT